MDNTFELISSLKKSVIANRLVGLWPKKSYASGKLYALYMAILNIAFIHFVNIGPLFVATSSTTLGEFLDASYFISCFMGTVKAFFLFKYHSLLKKLITSEIFKTTNVNLSSNQRLILHNRMKRWAKVQWTYICAGASVFVAYIAGPIFADEEYSLPIKCLYPFDYKEPIIYGIIYFQQVVGAWGNIVLVCVGDKLLCGFLAYMSAECEVLVDMLKNLQGKLVRNKQNSKMISSLVQCIKYHKEIIKFSRNAELFFSPYLLLQFGSACLATTLMLTRLSTVDSIKGDFMFTVNMLIFALIDLFTFSWYGSELTAQSEKITYAVFESNWVESPKQFKQDMLIFMQRVETPIKIQAINFFPLSIETFTSILRTAWSYYTLLRQLSDED